MIAEICDDFSFTTQKGTVQQGKDSQFFEVLITNLIKDHVAKAD